MIKLPPNKYAKCRACQSGPVDRYAIHEHNEMACGAITREICNNCGRITDLWYEQAHDPGDVFMNFNVIKRGEHERIATV